MNNKPSSRDWFCEDLSDEAAFAIHLFLEQFTYNFGRSVVTSKTTAQKTR